MSTLEWAFLTWGIGLVMGGCTGCTVALWMIQAGVVTLPQATRDGEELGGRGDE